MFVNAKYNFRGNKPTKDKTGDSEMDMYMQIRMPLACFLIVSYTFGFYYLKKRLRTATSRAFECLMVSAVVHLLAEVITEYTVNNRDKVSVLFNYCWHLVFLISLTLMCGFIYYYFILYVERGTGRAHRYQKAILFAVCAVGILAELALPITYVDTAHGSYSLGPKAYALYVVVIYTMAELVYIALRYRAAVGTRKSNLILVSVGVFVAVSVVQMFFPYMLLTGLGVTMLALGIMVNAEDMNRYLAGKSGLYNALGCREILQELCIAQKEFQIAVYVFLGDDVNVGDGMRSIAKQLPEKETRMICGTLADNVLVVLPTRCFDRICRLPEKLPEPAAKNGKIRYKIERLSFDGSRTMAQVVDIVRDVRDRFEEDTLQRDDMTGLLRRRAFVHQVEHLLSCRQAFSFLMIDLDDFKALNDTYGHDVGDHVLKRVSECFRSEMRASDIICRMGGDEFAIVLRGATDREQVREVFARIQLALKQKKILPDDRRCVNISVGVKRYTAEEPDVSFQSVYTEADAALYRAKYSGKGQLAFADENHSEKNEGGGIRLPVHKSLYIKNGLYS